MVSRGCDIEPPLLMADVLLEDCIKAAAAIVCHAVCNENVQSQNKDNMDCRKGSQPIKTACADHLRSAFNKYSILLEQTRCICQRVLQEQALKCRSEEDVCAKSFSGTPSGQGQTCRDMIRQRTNLPCFNKRTILCENVISSSCIKPNKQSCCVELSANDHLSEHNASTTQDRASPCYVTSLMDIGRGKTHYGSGVEQISCCEKDSTQNTTTHKACRKSEHRKAACNVVTKNEISHTKSTIVRRLAGHNDRIKRSLDLENGPNNEHVVFCVTGMECTGCEGIVHKALGKLPGVSDLQVIYVTGTASCSIDPAITTIDEVIRIMQRTTKYKLSRFDDKNQFLDIATIKQTDEVNVVDGINSIKRINKATVRLGYDATIIGARSVLASFPGAHLAPPTQDQALSAGVKHVRRTLLYFSTATVLTIPVLVLTWGSTTVSVRNKMIIDLILATLVQAVAVPVFYSPAISALITSHMIEMDMLVVISITAAYGYSLVAFAITMTGITLETGPIFETSTLLITLVLLGRLIAAYSRKRAVGSVSLRSLQPAVANLVTTHDETDIVDARLLELNDTIVVHPSSQVVTDGTVIAGVSEIDQSMVTGESLPVRKSPGDDVTAGTMNGNGVLYVKVTRLPGRNTITDIAKLVDQAHGQKPRVQDLADKVAGYFVPVVIAITLIVTAVWVAINIAIKSKNTGGAIGNAITYGIAVLAISCPCALGLAVPMVLVVTGGKAARAGIIIKTANVIERGYKTTDVIFDKTGTLTTDKLSVVEEVYLDQASYTRKETIGLVKALTRDNTHPVSKAVSMHLQYESGADVQVGEIKVLPGLGVTGLSNGRTLSAGSVEMEGVTEHPRVKDMVTRGLTLFCVASDAKLLAVFGLRTTIRSEARASTLR